MTPRFRTWSRTRKPQPARKAASPRLFVEPLEDRRLLAASIVPEFPPYAPNPAANPTAFAAGLPLAALSPHTASTAANASGLAADLSVASFPPHSASSAAKAVGFTAVPNLVQVGPDNTPGPNGYTPAQLRQAYGFNQLTGLPGNNYNNAGRGETIAIVDAYNDSAIRHDVQQFDEYFNIVGAANDPTSTNFFRVVNQTGGSPQNVSGPGFSDWDKETSIDVEWAHAMAPGANILLVEAASPAMTDLDAAVQYAASQPNLCVVSMSFNTNFEFSAEYTFDGLYTTPIGHQGVAFVAASGDSGVQASSQLWSQASPNIIDVGGTTLPPNASGAPDRSQEVGWSFGSDAFSPNVAGGGGFSQYEAEPAYQQGTVTQGTIYRAEPDVAYDADPATGVPIYDSLSTPAGAPWAQYGGTSIAAPPWASLIAIADQARAAKGEPTLNGPTQLLPALYQIAHSDPHAFQDMTQGFNGYSAGPGYDLVTGLGTPNVQDLVPDLVKIDSTPATPVTVYWTGDAGDHNWDDPGNWSLADPARSNVPQSVLPGPNANVVIDLAGAKVNHSITRYDTIRSLAVTAPNVMLNLDSGTLDLSGGGNLGGFHVQSTNDSVNLIGGVLKSANISSRTTITIPPCPANVPSVVDGGILNGTLRAMEGSILELKGSWTNNGAITAGTGSTLVLGDYWNAAASDPGATSDSWVNNGSILANGATVELGGWLTNDPDNLGSLALGSDAVELIGTLDNRNATLALAPGQSSRTGSWLLRGGRIAGGAIATSGGAALVAAGFATYSPSANGTLDGVTLNGALDMSLADSYVEVVDGLTLNTDLYLSGLSSGLRLDGGSTIAVGSLVPSATIHLNGAFSLLYNSTSSNALLNNVPTQTATIGSHITISGESVDSLVAGPFDNLGTIEQNTPGQLLVQELINDGSVAASLGGTVTLDSLTSFSYGGIYFFPGQPWSNNGDGTIAATSGAALNLYDQWTNNGAVSVDSTSTVSLGSPAGNASYSPAASDIWKNAGTFSLATGATVNLGDYFTTDEFESGFQNLGIQQLDLTKHTINLIGTIDNIAADNPVTGGLLSLGPATGTLFLAGGEINGGTITGTAPVVATTAGGTLNNVVVDAAIDVPASARLTLQGNWNTTLNGSITATAATLNLYDTWTNQGAISADAGSTVSLGNYSSLVSGASDIWQNSGTLAIAPGATIYLGDYFTTDEYENGFADRSTVALRLSLYTVYLIGILDNSPADNPITHGILALSASTGALRLGLGNPVYFGDGEVSHGTITTSGTADLVAFGGTLNNATLAGELDFSTPSSSVNVTGTLTLDTDLDLSGVSASLYFFNGGAIAVGPLVQSATVNMIGGFTQIDNYTYSSGLPNPVTIGRGITIFSENPSFLFGPFDNLGTIEQNGPGQLYAAGVVNDGSIQANGGVVTLASNELYINAPIPWSNNADGAITATRGEVDLLDEWVNKGTVTVDSSSAVSLGASPSDFVVLPTAGYIWSNTGTLSIAAGATVNLGDYFTTDEFENGFQQLGVNLNLSLYRVNLIGIDDNSPVDNPITQGTLALSSATGPLYISGGTINQGTIVSQGSDDFVVTAGGATLNAVTLHGQLDMSEPNSVVFVTNGLTLDTDLSLSGPGASLYFFDGIGNTLSVGPLAQQATIHLNGAGASLVNAPAFGIQTVIVGPGITISGENPSSLISGFAMENLGTVTQGAGQMTLDGLVNAGTVTVGNGGTVSAQDFANAGTVTIAAGGAFSVTADINGATDYVQWAGTTTVDGLLTGTNVFLNGGLLTGAGTIQANVTNAATIMPGDSVGTLTVQGNYTQTAAGVLLIQIASSTQYDRLAVTGSATLDGTLEVSLLGNYVPTIGTNFQVLTFADYTGGFSTEIGLSLPHQRHLKPVWDSKDLTLTVTN